MKETTIKSKLLGAALAAGFALLASAASTSTATAGPAGSVVRTEIVRERLTIDVPANRAVTILTFNQPTEMAGARGFLSIVKGEDSTGPVLLSYPVNNGQNPPLIKDLTIGGPTQITVDPPSGDGGVAVISYRVEKN